VGINLRPVCRLCRVPQSWSIKRKSVATATGQTVSYTESIHAALQAANRNYSFFDGKLSSKSEAARLGGSPGSIPEKTFGKDSGQRRQHTGRCQPKMVLLKTLMDTGRMALQWSCLQVHKSLVFCAAPVVYAERYPIRFSKRQQLSTGFAVNCGTNIWKFSHIT